MDINTDSMQKVTDVNKRSYSPDLKYSESTERWTMNQKVQDALGLDDSSGLQMYIAEDNNTGEQVVLLEIVDAEDASFFKGKTNNFTAHRLTDVVDGDQFKMEPIDDMENTYVLRDWEGESYILDNMSIPTEEENTDEIEEDLSQF